MKFATEDKMCLKKRRYPSDIAAAGAIGEIRVKYPDAALVSWRYYPCPNCRGYHITKQSQDNPEYQKRKWLAGIGLRDCTKS